MKTAGFGHSALSAACVAANSGASTGSVMARETSLSVKVTVQSGGRLART